MPNQEDFGYVTDEDDGNDSLITQSFYKQEVKKKRARDIKKDRPYKAKYNVLRASAPEVKIGKKERREAYKQSRATTLSQSTMLSRHRAERFAQEKCGSRKTEKVRKALNRAEKRAYQETISAARKLCEDSEDESEDEIDSDKEELKRIAKQIMIFQPDAPEVISDKRLQDAQRKLRQAGKK